MVGVKVEDNHNILFWQTRIKITEAPEVFKPQEIPETAIPFYRRHEDIRSFLHDPFGKDPSGTYGLELTANDRFLIKITAITEITLNSKNTLCPSLFLFNYIIVTFGLEMETLVSSQLLQIKDATAGALARLQKTKPKSRWK